MALLPLSEAEDEPFRRSLSAVVAFLRILEAVVAFLRISVAVEAFLELSSAGLSTILSEFRTISRAS